MPESEATFTSTVVTFDITREALSDADCRIGLLKTLGDTRVFKIDGKDCFQCRSCKYYFETRYESERSHRRHVRLCRRTYQSLQGIYRSDPSEMDRALERSNAICESIALRNSPYLLRNDSIGSGIGAFSSDCMSFVGYRFIRILEGGLLGHKMRSIRHIFAAVKTFGNKDIRRTLIEKPNAAFTSALNDLLAFCHKYGRTNSSISSEKARFWYETLYSDIPLMWHRILHAWLKSDDLVKIDPGVLHQFMATRRLMSFDDRALAIEHDNIITLLILCSCTSITSREIKTGVQMLYRPREDLYNVSGNKRSGYLSDTYTGLLYEDRAMLFPKCGQTNSLLNPKIQSFLLLCIALQIYRRHIHLIYHKISGVEFGIMSRITPYLETVNPDQTEIRSGIRKMTWKFLSCAKMHLKANRTFRVELFKDMIQAISLLDGINCNSEAWDGFVNQWLIRDALRLQSDENLTFTTRVYWVALQGFRESARNERLSQRCQAIFDNPLVLKCLAHWLDVPGLETCTLKWEDLDPVSNWSTGFWHMPIPPKDVSIRRFEYCEMAGRWRKLREEFDEQIGAEKLFGSAQSQLSDECEIFRFDDDFFCFDCDHKSMKDWRAYLQWEGREVHVKDMIRENLRRTRPDIFNDDHPQDSNNVYFDDSANDPAVNGDYSDNGSSGEVVFGIAL